MNACLNLEFQLVCPSTLATIIILACLEYVVYALGCQVPSVLEYSQAETRASQLWLRFAPFFYVNVHSNNIFSLFVFVAHTMIKDWEVLP